jgi:hypothetical protein
MATLKNLAIGTLRLAGRTDIAANLRHHAYLLTTLGIT